MNLCHECRYYLPCYDVEDDAKLLADSLYGQCVVNDTMSDVKTVMRNHPACEHFVALVYPLPIGRKAARKAARKAVLRAVEELANVRDEGILSLKSMVEKVGAVIQAWREYAALRRG